MVWPFLPLPARFDHVRVDGALRQPFGVGQLAGFGLEHLDEFAADDFALGFRVADAGQVAQELVCGVDADDFDAQILGEHVHHHVAFVQAQQAVVDEHAGQLVANGAVDQRGGDGGIDAAGQAENDFVAADLLADFRDRFGDVVAHDPVGLAAADFMHKAVQHGLALHRVRHFRVELHAVETGALRRPCRRSGSSGCCPSA